MEVMWIKKDMVSVKAYAKINLFLNITGILDDGYHTLDMIMQSVSVYDTVTVTKTNSSDITLKCTDKWIPTNEKNIAVRCALKFFEFINMSNEGIHINIEKSIPQQAGMAGGSADGAGVLVCLNALYGTNLSLKTLCSLGKQIGADIPFCLTQGTALVQGIGDKITRLKKLKDIPLVIIKPKVGINTKLAYDKYDNMKIKNDTQANLPDIRQAVSKGDINALCDNMYNVFESVSNNEQVNAAKRLLVQNGAVGSMMTGSGSAVFGIFDSRQKAKACYENVKTMYDICFLTKTR